MNPVSRQPRSSAKINTTLGGRAGRDAEPSVGNWA